MCAAATADTSLVSLPRTRERTEQASIRLRVLRMGGKPEFYGHWSKVHCCCVYQNSITMTNGIFRKVRHSGNLD